MLTKKALATPVARKLAKDLGVDITTISGQGANGRVMKEDILPPEVTTKNCPCPANSRANPT